MGRYPLPCFPVPQGSPLLDVPSWITRWLSTGLSPLLCSLFPFQPSLQIQCTAYVGSSKSIPTVCIYSDGFIFSTLEHFCQGYELSLLGRSSWTKGLGPDSLIFCDYHSSHILEAILDETALSVYNALSTSARETSFRYGLKDGIWSVTSRQRCRGCSGSSSCNRIIGLKPEVCKTLCGVDLEGALRSESFRHCTSIFLEFPSGGP